MGIWQIVLLSFLMELIEIFWQYSPTLKGSLEKMNRLFSRSIFLFLMAHTGYLYLLFISLRYDLLNWPIIVAISLKTLDIFTKINLLRAINGDDKELNSELSSELLGLDIPKWLWIISPFTYPWLIYLAFQYQ